MKTEFKDELLDLANKFLFENTPTKGDSISQIRKILNDNIKNDSELNLINNLLNRKYVTQISDFCTTDGREYNQLMISIFSLIFSILSFQE